MENELLMKYELFIEPRLKIRGDSGYFVPLCYTKFQNDVQYPTEVELKNRHCE